MYRAHPHQKDIRQSQAYSHRKPFNTVCFYMIPGGKHGLKRHRLPDNGFPLDASGREALRKTARGILTHRLTRCGRRFLLACALRETVL